MIDFITWFLSLYNIEVDTKYGAFFLMPMALEFYALFASASLMLFFALISALMHFKGGRE